MRVRSAAPAARLGGSGRLWSMDGGVWPVAAESISGRGSPPPADWAMAAKADPMMINVAGKNARAQRRHEDISPLPTRNLTRSASPTPAALSWQTGTACPGVNAGMRPGPIAGRARLARAAGMACGKWRGIDGFWQRAQRVPPVVVRGRKGDVIAFIRARAGSPCRPDTNRCPQAALTRPRGPPLRVQACRCIVGSNRKRTRPAQTLSRCAPTRCEKCHPWLPRGARRVGRRRHRQASRRGSDDRSRRVRAAGIKSGPRPWVSSVSGCITRQFS